MRWVWFSISQQRRPKEASSRLGKCCLRQIAAGDSEFAKPRGVLPVWTTLGRVAGFIDDNQIVAQSAELILDSELLGGLLCDPVGYWHLQDLEIPQPSEL